MVAESGHKQDTSTAVQSTDTATPSQSAPKRTDALCCVILMDGTRLEVPVDKRAKGGVLFAEVVDRLNLVEKSYFGLSFREEDDTKVWLQTEKRISKQIGNNTPWTFFFEVRFYPPDPNELREDVTKYYVTVHVRNDIACGRLPCSFVTYAVLGAHLVQSQFGDYDPTVHGPGTEYLRDFPIAPEPVDPLLLEKVAELHRSHSGEPQAKMEYEYLDKVKRLALYGVERHPAKDSENEDISLGVCATGIMVYHDQLRVNRFAWPKIMKVSFRRNIFYIKLCQGEFEQSENTVGFRLPSQKAAKRLWKSAVAHHAFFRLMSSDVPAEKKSTIPRIGSTKYRFLGPTLYQSRLDSALNDRQQPSFSRSFSTRLPTTSIYSLAENGVPQSHSVPLEHQGFQSQSYHVEPIKEEEGAIPEIHPAVKGAGVEQVFTVETFPSNMAEAGRYGAGDAIGAEAVLVHQDPTSAYRPDLYAAGGGQGSPQEEMREAHIPSPDREWTLTKSTMEQREQTGEPETETITETLPDGTIVTRTITKTRVVKQVISKQVIETHGSEDMPIHLEAGSVEQGILESAGRLTGPEEGGRVHETHTRSFLLSGDGREPMEVETHTSGEFVSSQSVTSGDGKTVETLTYKTERDGKTETHTEKRVVIHGEGISHDAELTAAILEATQMDPDVTVEKFEVRQQRQS